MDNDSTVAISTTDSANKNSLKKQQDFKTFIFDFMMGGISASICKTLLSPIEVIKLKFPSYYYMPQNGVFASQPPSFINCGYRISAKQGVTALWKGNFLSVWRVFRIYAPNFALNDFFKRAFNVNKDSDGYLLWLITNFTSGGLAGACSLSMVYPIDLTNIKFFNDRLNTKKCGVNQFTSIFDVYKKTFAVGGISGLYKGFLISCFGVTIYRSLYFGIYDSIKPSLPLSINNCLLANIIIGWLTTVFANFASYPIDTIRRRMIMATGDGKKQIGTIQWVKIIFKEQKIASFFKGARSNLMRGMVGGGTLAVYDRMQKYVFRERGKGSEVVMKFQNLI